MCLNVACDFNKKEQFLLRKRYEMDAIFLPMAIRWLTLAWGIAVGYHGESEVNVLSLNSSYVDSSLAVVTLQSDFLLLPPSWLSVTSIPFRIPRLIESGNSPKQIQELFQ